MKKCIGCGQEKELSEFAEDKSRIDGKCPYCKVCRRKQEGERRRKQNELKAAATTIKCAKCGEEKPKSEFTPRQPRHKTSRYCLKCREEKRVADHQKRLPYENEKYHSNKEVIRNKRRLERERVKTELMFLIGGECADCGLKISEEWPSACFDFHHINPEEKEFSIGSVLRYSRDMQRLFEEAKKCSLLCSNCHRRRHYLGLAVPIGLLKTNHLTEKESYNGAHA
jgi:hypothetical protein